MSASVQRVINVYEDQSGDKCVVKDDEDALGLIVIEQETARISITPEQALLVSKALLQLAATPFEVAP